MLRKRVLVVGDYRQTVTIVRSLGRAGFDVVLGCEQPHSSTALSRHVSAVRLFDSSSPERYCEYLEACLKRDKPDFAFPVGEAQLRRLLCHGPERLAPLATWIMPDPAAVLRCFDKRAMYHLAAALGIPTPAWRPFTGVLGWLRDVEELGYPVVIKRKDSSAKLRGTNAVICRCAGEFGQFLAETGLDPDPASLVLQKHAAGFRHNCHVAADRGRIVAFFQQKVLRTDERDGTGMGVEGISVAPSPRLRAYCESLLGSLRYTGIGCIQFLVDDRTGAIAFLELNARMDSTAALPYRLGVDFPLIALKIAAGEPVNAPADYAVGKRNYSLYGDVNAWLAHRRREPLGRVLAWPLKMPWIALRSYDLVFDWRDPLPALHQFWNRAVEFALKRATRAAGKDSVESGAHP